jgi:hypothetical protein
LTGSLLPYFIPFGVALAIGGVLRLAAGPNYGARLAGLGILFGFAAAWNWLLLTPWVPHDPLSRVIHIAIGGFLFGLVLDFVQPRRSITSIVVAIYTLGSVWATISGALLGPPPEEVGGWLRLVIYLLMWFGLFWRFTALRLEGPSVLIFSVMLALGLALVAQMSGEGAIAAAAYCLVAAVAGHLILTWVLALAVSQAVILGCGGTVLALAMALADPFAEASIIALFCLFLVPFADGTTKRLPLGPVALRPALYPLALMVVCLMPVGLSAVIAFLLSGR